MAGCAELPHLARPGIQSGQQRLQFRHFLEVFNANVNRCF
jgi:hypothetical protein